MLRFYPESNHSHTRCPWSIQEPVKILEHPYENLNAGAWLRGNLHAHTDSSDGQRPLRQVIGDYVNRGYDFLMISDHDIYTNPQKHDCGDTKNIVLIPGNEITAGGPHLLHVYADRLVVPHPQRQNVINQINSTRGFAVVNHPNWGDQFDHCTRAQLFEWIGYRGLEIYNGVVSRDPGSPYATNKWDMVLKKGHRVWGFANDDSHAATGDVGLGWNMVYTSDKTASSIVDALSQGRFYPSTGVVITDIQVEEMNVTLKTKNARRITALCEDGKRIKVVDGPTMQLPVPENVKYVRFECWGDGEQFAWTQPFFVN